MRRTTGSPSGGTSALTDVKDAHDRTLSTRRTSPGTAGVQISRHMIAHAINHVRGEDVTCTIFACDSVAGGVFDFSAWWELAAGDRAALGLQGKVPEAYTMLVRLGMIRDVDARADAVDLNAPERTSPRCLHGRGT